MANILWFSFVINFRAIRTDTEQKSEIHWRDYHVNNEISVLLLPLILKRFVKIIA